MTGSSNDPKRRKELLKHMILQLHDGHAPDAVRAQLVRVLGQVPYDEVVEVEQELIAGGLPIQEVLRLCDVHTAAMKGAISQEGAKSAPPGHPVHAFREENKALARELSELDGLYAAVRATPPDDPARDAAARIRARFNALMDVEKHYLRKEHLLFPILERHGINGPPTVMWGKHDEARRLLGDAIEAVQAAAGATAGELAAVVDLALKPAAEAVAGMIDKEEQILLPMSLDTLTEPEWGEIAAGSAVLGWCLVAPTVEWRPEIAPVPEPGSAPAPAPVPEPGGAPGRIRMPSGALSLDELVGILNVLPVDLSFVDRDDTVRWFTEGARIFPRTRAVIGRKVQFCHPPSSVHVVNEILDAFRAGRQDRASFWIEMRGRFLSIEYFPVRDAGGEYLGCLEVTQDLTAKRALTGQRRLLEWDSRKGGRTDGDHAPA